MKIFTLLSNLFNQSPDSNFEKGTIAFSSGDYKEALKYFLKAANQGHVIAQCNLGVIYDAGQIVQQDHKKAFKWYQKAATQNYFKAQYNLAGMYYDEQNYNEALKWFKKSAVQGDTQAQYNLGVMYEQGKGVLQNIVEAKKYYGMTCDGGHQKSCDAYRELN